VQREALHREHGERGWSTMNLHGLSDDRGFKAAVDTGAFSSMAEGLLVEAHESDLSVASEVTQARVTEALKVGAETYEGELEMDYLSRLSPIR
jgi:hypothetical protein